MRMRKPERTGKYPNQVYDSSVSLYAWLLGHQKPDTQVVEREEATIPKGSVEEIIIHGTPDDLRYYDTKLREFYKNLGFEVTREYEVEHQRPFRDIYFENRDTGVRLEVYRSVGPCDLSIPGVRSGIPGGGIEFISVFEEKSS